MISIALKYHNKYSQRISLIDIVQSGIVGIGKASKTYNYHKPTASFGSYAYKFILGDIIHYIQHYLKGITYTYQNKQVNIISVDIGELEIMASNDGSTVANNIDLNAKIEWLYKAIDICKNKKIKKTLKDYAKGRSIKDIAAEEGVTVVAIWLRIQKGIECIKDYPL